MELVNDDYSINCAKFKCLDSGYVYTLLGSQAAGDIEHTIDTISREDGHRGKTRRSSLKKKFKNIEPLTMFYEPKTSKRSKSKGRK